MHVLTLAAISLTGTARAAEILPMDLFHDDGVASGAARSIGPGDVEAVRFRPFVPCLVETVLVQFAGGPGRAELRFWADNGAHRPDLERELAPRTAVEARPPGEWTEVEIAPPLSIDPARGFFVGVFVATPTITVAIDGTASATKNGVVRVKGEWRRLAEGDLLVRAIGEYRAPDTFFFRDITEKAGLGAPGRLAWGDYDGDGYEDVMVNGSRLFHNEGDGRFADATETAGLAGSVARGGVFGDYDNDGDLDFYAFTDIDGRDQLWRNNGDGTFTEVGLSAGCFDPWPTEAASWADYDRDGFLDLYVANYEMPGRKLGIGTPGILWHNEGNGTFSEATARAGMVMDEDPCAADPARAPRGQPPRCCGRGTAAADYDNDGDLDLFVANYRLNPNFLWRNNGDGTFTEVGLEAGVRGNPADGRYGHSIGAAWGDIDNDGNLDLVVTNLAHPDSPSFANKTMIYLNTGPPDYGFVDIREAAGVAYAETHAEPVLFDYDNDGFLDLFLTSVYEGRESFLYHNNGDLTFTETSGPAGVMILDGWGATAVDFDLDGDLDLVGKRVFENLAGNRNAWLEMALSGPPGRPSPVGARVTARAGDRRWIREVAAGKGSGNQDSMLVHFGLGDLARLDEVEVRWPDGGVDVLRCVKTRRLIRLAEGARPPAGGGERGGCDGRTDLPPAVAFGLPVLWLVVWLWWIARRGFCDLQPAPGTIASRCI